MVARYLDCGIFERGFALIRCPDCAAEYRLAFSCKGRGLCPIRHLEPPAVAAHAGGTLDLIEARFAGRDMRTRPIAQLADEVSVPLETALERLAALGIEADASTTAGTLAAKHGLDPIDVVVVLALDSRLRSHPAH